MHWVLCRVELVYAPRWCLGMSSSHPLFYPCHNCLFVFEMNINDKQYIILFGHFIIQILKNGLSYCQLNLLLIWQILYICTTHQTLLQTCSSFLKIHNRFLVNTISLYKLHIVVENKNSVQTYRGSWRMNECQLVSCLQIAYCIEELMVRSSLSLAFDTELCLPPDLYSRVDN